MLIGQRNQSHRHLVYNHPSNSVSQANPKFPSSSDSIHLSHKRTQSVFTCFKRQQSTTRVTRRTVFGENFAVAVMLRSAFWLPAPSAGRRDGQSHCVRFWDFQWQVSPQCGMHEKRACRVGQLDLTPEIEVS